MIAIPQSIRNQKISMAITVFKSVSISSHCPRKRSYDYLDLPDLNVPISIQVKLRTNGPPNHLHELFQCCLGIWCIRRPVKKGHTVSGRHCLDSPPFHVNLTTAAIDNIRTRNTRRTTTHNP